MLLNQFYKFLSDLRFIFSTQYQDSKRFNLFLCYSRLRLKKPFNRFFKYKKEHFLGYKVDFPDYHDFFEMFREIFIRKAYYFETDTKNPSIIDCGGNIGISILFFKYLYPEAEITVFEPSPKIFKFLKQNIEQNNFQNVKFIQAALHKKNESIPFYSFTKRLGGGGSTTIKGVMISKSKKQPVESELIPAVPLSEYINKPIDFLKIDTEGSEGVIINELNTSNKISSIKECVLEYHYNKENQENILSKLLNIFQSNGFHLAIFEDEVDIPRFSLKNKKFYHFMIRAYR